MFEKARTNALLRPLAGPVAGDVSDGCLRGSYRGYAIEARPHSGYPIKYLSGSAYGSVGPASVNMLRVTLSGVTGIQSWHCQSNASGAMHDLVSRFTPGSVLKGFKPGEFKFHGVDLLTDSAERMGEKLVKTLGMPIKANADSALQERLIAAGLFDELDALRFGGHPYLPKVQYFPSGREFAEGIYMKSSSFARAQPVVEERLRAAGLPDYRTLMESKMREIEKESPGHLQLDVEAGKGKVLSVEQFSEMLEHAAQIAQINVEVNATVDPGAAPT